MDWLSYSEEFDVLVASTKKRIHDDADVRVTIDRETGDYESFRRWEVLPDAFSVL